MRQRYRLKNSDWHLCFFGSFLAGQKRNMDGSLLSLPYKKRNKN